jgi:MYXO-CTERM domain-containing protein
MDSDASGDGPWLFLVGGLAVLALWSLRRRPVKQAEIQPSLSSRLEQLRSEVDGDALRVAALHSELTHLLRAAYGDDSSGWSDEEWVERAELNESQRADLRGVFSSCAEVKYGGARPTRFAVEEILERAQALISQSEEVAA